MAQEEDCLLYKLKAPSSDPSPATLPPPKKDRLGNKPGGYHVTSLPSQSPIAKTKTHLSPSATQHSTHS
jgi:hypothetical protein